MTPFLVPSALTALRSGSVTAAAASGFASRRLASTLVLAEHRDGRLSAATLHAVSAAVALGGPVTALVVGGDAAVASAAAQVQGVARVLHAPTATASSPAVAESVAPVIAGAAARGGFSHVVAAHTAFGKNVVPRAAALLDAAQVADVVGVVGEDTFLRPIYAGNAIAKVRSKDKVKLLTVRGTAFAPAAATGGQAVVEQETTPVPSCELRAVDRGSL
ncbi:Electron transfer flavoprotein alpha-subunit [Cladochytrium tenue]|nr:Electron transfer flavoprotein alpha-subunit [Cladochytrium tenue]